VVKGVVVAVAVFVLASGSASGLSFSPSSDSPFAVGRSPFSVAVGDFNGDGKLDLATSDYPDNSVSVLLGDGSGGFVLASGSPIAMGGASLSAAVGDFNGDHQLDIATANYFSSGVAVLLGDGSGGFSAASGAPFAVGRYPTSVAVGISTVTASSTSQPPTSTTV
jgi:hypothetical protein